MDLNFKHFCDNLEIVLDKHQENIDPDEDLLVRQRKQIKRLVLLEKQFRLTLVKHGWGPGVYKDFVKHVVDDCRNVLSARPFFRERHEVFSAEISKALKNRREKQLYKFRINWTFVEWVMKSRKWRPGSEITKIAEEIAKARQELLEQNLPLAISQAGIFWRSTPKSHLSWMDIVQIQCQGLLLAIDKFVPPDDKKMSDKQSLARYRIFRAVAIGIMRRDRVNAYSETLIHFYPKDKLKIYQANKLLRRTPEGGVNYEKMAETISNNLAEQKINTNAEEIQSLLAAAGTVSIDFQVTNSETQEEGDSMLDSIAADVETSVEEDLEHEQAVREMYKGIGELSLLEKKLLKLKGIEIV
jgi:DNA-directed RNA polymerase specialized sigma subunit